MIFEYLTLFLLAFAQNVSFSLVSRARNRDHMGYIVATSILSNGIFFATFGILVKADMSLDLAPFYLAGTVAGTVWGAKVSMRIEDWLGAKT